MQFFTGLIKLFIPGKNDKMENEMLTNRYHGRPNE